MKALSIRQPWASLILGIAPETPNLLTRSQPKNVENRSWRTHYRGPLVIHAGKAIDTRGIWRCYTELEQLEIDWPRGVLLGVVNVTACRDDLNSIWAEKCSWHWALANPRAFVDPIPYKGRLGLFDVDLPERIWTLQRRRACCEMDV